MTQEEYIEHLCDVINAVFKAEDAISKERRAMLIAAAIGDKGERDKIAQEYVHAIAEEMLAGYLRSGHTMEELMEEIA